MSADNFKITNNLVGLWNKNNNAVRNASTKSASSINKSSVANMDTFEISNKETKATQTNYKVSPEINKEKTEIVRELSQSHSDVNKFLEIKAQVRAGNYDIDAKSIAQSIIADFDYDFKA